MGGGGDACGPYARTVRALEVGGREGTNQPSLRSLERSWVGLEVLSIDHSMQAIFEVTKLNLSFEWNCQRTILLFPPSSECFFTICLEDTSHNCNSRESLCACVCFFV